MNIRHFGISLLMVFSITAQGQYLETYSTPNKGYLLNFIDDFTTVNWTMTPWSTAMMERDAMDYFNTTAAGVLESIDMDQEVCWESPLLQIGSAGTVSLSVDLTWAGFDTDVMAGGCLGDYIRVMYSVNGGAYTMVPNQFGGNACATVAYPFGAPGAPFTSSGTVTQGGISGSTLRIRVCVFTNANAEIVTIDNVSVPQSGVSLNCSQPILTTTQKNIVCNGPNSGSIDLTVSGGSGGGYTYDWSNDGPETPDNDPQDLTGLAAGSYTVTVTDGANCTQTTTVNIISSPMTQSAVTFPASCGGANGAIDLTVGGGNPGYTYVWTGGATTQDISGLAAGSYSVTVTDTSVPPCTSTATYMVGSMASGPYLETFSIINKGYLLNQVNNFFGMNWTMSPWTLDEPPAGIGRDNGDYFATTAAGKLEGLDSDQEICWISPEINIATSGTVQFSVDLTWMAIDNEDYILVQYSLNGGAFVTIPNVVGGGVGTIQYAFPSADQSGSTTVTQTGLSGNKLQIKVCFLTNSQADIITVDNVSIPQTVSLCFAPILTTTQVNVLCNGAATGSIDLSVTGGTAPYTYDWSNDGPETPDNDTQDLTGLVAGTYTVTVTDMVGATSTASVTITQPAALALTSVITHVTCFGLLNGAINLSVSGGVSPYTYDWSNDGPETPDNDPQDLTGLAAGTYMVTVTDANGCTASHTAMVNQPTALSLSTVVTNVTCAGGNNGAIDLTVTGGTPGYTYDWSNDGPETPDNDTQDLTNLTTGTYTVTVTDANGCTSTASQTLTANPLPLAFAVTGGGTYCDGNGVVVGLAGSEIGVNYQLYVNAAPTGAPFAGTGAAFNFPGLQTVVGTYTVAGTNPTTTCMNNMTGSVQVATAIAPVINSVTVIQPTLAFPNGSITVNATGGPTLEYRLNSGPYQLSKIFNGLPQDSSYSVFVRLQNSSGCEVAYSGNPVAMNAVAARFSCLPDVLVGTSPFQDSMWHANLATNTIIRRLAPSLPGFTITGMNGLATHPQTGEHFILLKVSGISGRLLAKVNIHTGVCTTVGNTGDNFSSITFHSNGTLYGATGNGASVPETLYELNTTTGAKTLRFAMGNGADGEVICYNTDDDHIYHWSGNGTVVFEKWPSAAMTYAPINVPITGTPGGETFGAIYRGDNKFIISNISSTFKEVTLSPGGASYGPNLMSLPDDLRGLIKETCISSITVSGLPIVCEQGSVTLTVNGGSNNYQWYINGAIIPGANSASYVASTGGFYNCIFTDPCGVTDSVPQGIILTTATNPVLSSIATPACFGEANGAIDLTVTGGTPIYTYDWSNDGPEVPDNDSQDLINLSAGTYTVTVTDANGCMASESATVLQPALPLNITLMPTGNCTGSSNGTITVGITGGTPLYDIAWNGPGSNDGSAPDQNSGYIITNLPGGSYAVTVTDNNNCSQSTSVVVVENPVPVCAISGSDSLCMLSIGNIYATTPGLSGYAWSISGNATIVGPTTGSSVSVTAGVPGNANIAVTITDANGCSSSCAQTIQIISNAPFITCPTDITIECDESTQPANTGNPVVLDCDFDATISFGDVTTSGNCPQEYTISRTWTALDGMGQSASCVQIISVQDNTLPSLSCPPDITVQCIADTLTANTGLASGTDNCDAVPEIDYSDTSVSGTCGGSFFRIWTVTDACGNNTSCPQLITIDDTTPPVITFCPTDVTIECDESTLPANTGNATASDNCDNSPSVAYDEFTFYPNEGGCVQEFVVVRTWIVTDDCNNSATCVQEINVVDTTPPVITCPPNLTIQCIDNTLPAGTGVATATDNCTSFPEIFSNDVTVAGGCGPEYTIMRTWTALDDCGNGSTCTQIISIKDTAPPVITCPANITVQCTVVTIPANTGGNATATDICDQTPTVTFTDVTVAGACPQERTITRTWRATDDCGNSSSCVQTIFVDDSTPPAITCPQNLTVTCSSQIPPIATGSVTSTDNCGPVTVTHLGDVISDSTCVNRFVIHRTYKSTDACGNMSTCTQLITVFDNTPPTITCPANITIQCSASTLPANTGMASATDNCQGGGMSTPQIWINEFHYDNTGTDAGEFVEVAGTAGIDLSTYSIVLYNGTGGFVYDTDNLTGTIDNEGNGFGAVSLSYPVNGIQNGAPDGIALVHSGTVVQFLSYEGSFAATDGPANGMVSTDIGLLEQGTEPLGQSLQLTGSGNAYANFTWAGPSAQSPGTLNAGQTIASPPPAPLMVNYTDVITSSNICPQQYTITRTWSTFDACGNSATCTQVIVIVDTTPPAIACPPNLTIECTEDTSPAHTGTASASDNCQGTGVPLPVIWINEFHYDNTGTDAGEFVEVAGTAGLNLSGYTIVLYNGTGGAVYDTDNLTGVIDNESNGFGAISLAYPSNGIQNGAPDGIALVQGATVIQFLSYEGSFVAVGGPANGMMSTDIGVSEAGTEALGLSLRLTGNGDAYNEFVWNAPSAQSPGSLNPGQTITVVNDPNIPVTHTDNITPSQLCPQTYSITRTWTATDACGNSSTCTQLISVVDSTPPVITCPASVTIDFGVDESTEHNGYATATDNCSQPEVTYSDNIIPGECEEEYMIERTFIATDACGNSSTCLQIVNVDGMCVVDFSLVKTLNPNQGPFDGGDNVQFTITVTNEGEVTAGSITITDYIPIGFMLNDPDWTPGMAGSTGQSASIVLSIANGGLDANGLNPMESVSVQITLRINDDTGPGSYVNIAEISQVLRPNGVDITDRDIDSDPDQIDTNDPPSEDDQDPAYICILPTVVIIGDAYVCPGQTVTYFVEDYHPNWQYSWTLSGGGVIVATTAQSVTIAWGDTPGGPFQLTLITIVGPEGCQTSSFMFVYIQGVEALSCNDQVQISLGPECESIVLSGMILEGEAEGNDNYYVIITDENGNVIPNATLTSEHIGKCFTVTVANECNDQSCWGTICVEDKIKPVIECADVTVDCGSILDPETTTPEAYDACGDVELTYTESTSGDACDIQVVTRTWTATDESGNTSTCVQHITVTPLTLDQVAFPPAYVGLCGESADPEHTGWPTVNGIPITDENDLCNIFVGYWDKELNECGGGRKIARTWTVLDWCNVEVVEGVQVIKLSDNVGPELTCPEDYEVGTDFWYCYANVSVPKPAAVDNCSEISTYSLHSTGGTVVSFGNNYVINGLELGTHTVTWTVRDECGNSSTCSFHITVVDDVVPVANCDLHTIVSLTNDGPSGITLVPASVFDDGSYDNCGPVTFRARRMDSCIDFDWTTEGACIDDHPGGIPAVNSRDRGTVHRPCVPFACCDVGNGPVMVELEVTDAAGNVNYCMVEAEIQDKISPFVECPPDIIVSCDFWFNVQEGTFVDGEGNNNGSLDEDPLSAVFGNMFDAYRYDESARDHIVINDPGNEDYSQPHNWGVDGWADDNCEVNLQVRVRIIDDCSGGDLPGNAPEGAIKLIERRFSASDGNEGIAPGTCTQRIWVVDYDPFYIVDQNCNNQDPNDGVKWPCDVLLTTCPEDLGNTGEPTIYDDACSLVGVTYEDTRFDFVDGACFKILREWAVIDWCQYNPQTGAGLWHYTQVIKVHDEDGPAFTDACETQVLCVADDGVSLPDNNQVFLGEDNPLASSCSVHLALSRTVHETCSDIVNYDVKLYPFNGSDFIYLKTTTQATVDENNDAVLSFNTRQNSIKSIRDNGLPYNSVSCGDYHRILWSVEDGCGNWSHCEYLIRLEDCKLPSPVCINGLSTVVMPIGGQVTVWAKDFNASSYDDCTPSEDLLYSFSGDSYQPSFTYTCDNVPAFNTELPVSIWVADGGTDDNCNGQISWNERNKDFCSTTIVITDNNHACGGSGPIVSGEILTDHSDAVSQVQVSLTSPGHVFPQYITAQNGRYTFTSLFAGDDYQITPERNDDHRNGVSTLDLVQIQKHLLGKELFTTPYQYIAADANNSESVSAIDLIEIRKLILGLYVEYPNNKSWRFVEKGYPMTTEHPWPFNEAILLPDLAQDSMMHNDFVAIKVGDINFSAKTNATQVKPRNGNGVVNLMADNRTVNAGEMVDVAIRSTDFAGIEGYQFTMQANGLEFRGVESGLLTMTDENMGVFGNTLTTSWYKIGGVSATSSDVLFTLHFQATVAGQLSEMISLNSGVTEAEAYNTSADIKDLKLTFRGTEVGAEFALYQNEPNPFKGTTQIGYDLPVAGKATLTIFDFSGKVLVVKEQDAVKGYNTITITNKELGAVGVLYYRLDAGEYTATKKMVIIE